MSQDKYDEAWDQHDRTVAAELREAKERSWWVSRYSRLAGLGLRDRGAVAGNRVCASCDQRFFGQIGDAQCRECLGTK